MLGESALALAMDADRLPVRAGVLTPALAAASDDVPGAGVVDDAVRLDAAPLRASARGAGVIDLDDLAAARSLQERVFPAAKKSRPDERGLRRGRTVNFSSAHQRHECLRQNRLRSYS